MPQQDEESPAQHWKWNRRIAITSAIIALIGALATAGTFAFGDGFFSQRDSSDGCADLGEPETFDHLKLTDSGWWGWQTISKHPQLQDGALMAEFVRKDNEAAIEKAGSVDLRPFRCITAEVRAEAPSDPTNTTAKLYFKRAASGGRDSFEDDGADVVGSNGTLLKLDLTQYKRLDKATGVGIDFLSPDSSDEVVTIYVDQVSIYR